MESREENSERRKIRMTTFDDYIDNEYLEEMKNCNCTKWDCKSKFSIDDQKKWRSVYWNKPSNGEKNMFLSKLMCQRPKSSSTNINSSKKKRNYTIDYFLPMTECEQNYHDSNESVSTAGKKRNDKVIDEIGLVTQVCEKMFKLTLGISSKKVKVVLEKQRSGTHLR